MSTAGARTGTTSTPPAGSSTRTTTTRTTTRSPTSRSRPRSGESGVNYTHTFTYAYRAGAGYDVLSIDGVASQVSEGSFAAADSEATFDTFGRRIAMNYDVANGSTKKEEFSFDGEGREVYVYGRAKNGVRPQVHYTWANGELLGKNYEDGGVLYKWGGQVFHKGDTSARGKAAQGWGRKADFTETYEVTRRNGKVKEKHFSEAESVGVRYTRGMTGFQAGGSSYTVVSGDTLRGIAQKVYGHEGLWYLIADANGLNSDADLTAGLQLGIPETRVTSNDASTFKPYSPNALPIPQLEYQPPEQNMFVTALSIIVMVIVTIYTAGALSMTSAEFQAATFSEVLTAGGTAMMGGGFLIPAQAAAAGSVASQSVQIAGGNQDGFNLGQLGVSALSAGLLSWGIGSFSAAVKGAEAGTLLSKFGTFAETALPSGETIRSFQELNSIGLAASGAIGALSNMAAGQIITGHSGFRWSSMVASMVSTPLTNVTEVIGMPSADTFMGDFGRRLASAGISEGVKQAMGDGGRFNTTAAAVDAFGNALGNWAVRGFSAPARPKPTVEQLGKRIDALVDLKLMSPEQAAQLKNDANQTVDTLDAATRQALETAGVDKVSEVLGDKLGKVKTYTELPKELQEVFEKAGVWDSNGIVEGKEAEFWDLAKARNLARGVSINGVLVTAKDGTTWGEAIADQSGRIITHVYNPSDNVMFDVIQTAAEMFTGFTDVTTAAVAAQIKDAMTYNKTLGIEGLTTLVVGHSQGTVIATNALREMSSDEDFKLKNIGFVSLATATPVVLRGLGEYRGFVNLLDPVPYATLGALTLLTGQAGDAYSVRAQMFFDWKANHGVEGYLDTTAVQRTLAAYRTAPQPPKP